MIIKAFKIFRVCLESRISQSALELFCGLHKRRIGVITPVRGGTFLFITVLRTALGAMQYNKYFEVILQSV
jgi:hypothetical protein